MFQYTIHNLGYERFSLIDEIVSFSFKISVTEPEDYSFEHYVFLSKVIEFTKEKYPEFYQFWISTRKSVGDWGSNDHTTLLAAGESALELLYVFAVEYIESENILEALYFKNKAFDALMIENDSAMSQNIENDLRDMEESGKHINAHNLRLRKFCIAVEKAAREAAHEIYPEINQLESDQLLEFEYIFSTEIQKMFENLENLMSKSD